MNQSPHIIDVDINNFEQVVLQGSNTCPVLVDFWAPWCEPCKTLTPVLEKLADEYAGAFVLAKINTEEQQQIAAQFGIRSIPTVKLVHQGQLLEEFAGAIPEGQIRELLEKHVQPATTADPQQQQIEQLLQQGDIDGAIQSLNQISEKSPANLLTLAQLYAAKADYDTAQSILESLPEEERSKPEAKTVEAQLFFAALVDQNPNAEALQQRLEQDPKDCEAGYFYAAHLVSQNQIEPALDLLLEVMQKDRAYLDDGARKAILVIFELIGEENPLVRQYRNRLFNILH